MPADIARARKLLADAASLVVMTGAGVSAESGVATYRGAGGLWRTYNAQEVATPEAFARNPRLVWEMFDERRAICARCAPNAAHVAIAEREARTRDFTLVTQNVDGLHARAGSRRILEVHGTLWRIRCSKCGKKREDRTAPLPQLPPVCAACGGLERPDVVWFGEALDPRIIESVLESLLRADAALVVGTSNLVQPAASFAGIAKETGAYVVEVNVEPTPLTPLADVTVLGKAGDILPALLA